MNEYLSKEKWNEYLVETEQMNFSSPEVQAFIQTIPRFPDSVSQAVAIYETVRDSFLYDPYHLDLRPEFLKASIVANKNRAWCVEKSLLAAACFRFFGYPARLGFGIVKNHIGVEKLKSYLKRDEIVFHGYVGIWLEGKWSKCTPAFDPRICKLSGVPLLEWDGRSDSLFQAYVENTQFMEYIHFYGEFEDVPFKLMHAEMQKYYPDLFENPIASKAFSFHFDPKFVSI
ncbi:transglutaminase-like domain-containing protein [Fluviicola taffensis]|uniref:Transglutaminase domain-containing protein n=1 Tax=Fluviicola taffensis (strain DSM 16823 / NCIMB 13979 / RW262) TaxID=755732 RepID=F2IKI8_FLUTR|nr:transglutaminase-like domain-containing protein [Fluviicola taffensis]AEA45114.1 transglutaminase domain-containing protein [Fluviicola taffensis DSM 16823]